MTYPWQQGHATTIICEKSRHSFTKLLIGLVVHITVLEEQYPVTPHAPNFDFLTGCREIKRGEESKRTLKNPFTSRLAEFDTALKLLRITDQ